MSPTTPMFRNESKLCSGKATCRECGRSLGSGYVCDDCDHLEVLDQ